MKQPITFFVLSAFILAPISTLHAADFETQTEVEKEVRSYFKDIPAMIEIARCESNFRQFTDAGNVLRGGDSGGMIGVFQFFESIHAPIAKGLGYDLETLDGNLAYAKHIYEAEGTTPWAPAKHCWEIKPTTVKTPATRAELEAKIKQLMELIKLLKQLQELRAKQTR